MDIHRKTWNQGQQKLKAALLHPELHPEWLELFLRQHSEVHCSEMSPGGGWSFEDEVLVGLDDDMVCRVPDGEEHSIAWVIFHLARIEDVTMNMLVAGREQLAQRDNWLERMHVSIPDTANAFTIEKAKMLGQAIDIQSLYLYRQAVGRNTRRLVSQLLPGDLKCIVDSIQLEKVRSCGAVVADASEVLDYWSKRSVSGLLLMPPTRHCFVHLNEALRIRKVLSGTEGPIKAQGKV